MTPLPHNPAITVIDLPEDVTPDVSEYLTLMPYNLSPGNYKLICLGLQATEEEAREIVESHGVWVYTDYSVPGMTGYVDTATASLRSLITSNGWKNPVFLRNV